MRGAKKKGLEPELEMKLTPEQEAELEAGLAELARGDYIEIEFDENTPSIVAELRRRLREGA